MRSRAVSALTTIVIVALGLAGMALTGLSGSGAPAPAVDDALRTDIVSARNEAAAFLAEYVAGDGRVVRHDQGGDTVSEGQAYAMLLAVGTKDEDAFALVWEWTAANLQREDGLLSWRWADGEVVDPEPASDADLDAAWALALAERHWPGEGYGAEAGRLASAIHRLETVPHSRTATLLAAGPWAIAESTVVNPSYSSPIAEAVLVEDRHVDSRVAEARSEGARFVLDALLDQHALPSDWAEVLPDGSVLAVAAPSQDGAGAFGWDAVRVPIRYASSCEEDDQAVAAELWEELEDGAGEDLLGDHPVRHAAAAAAAAAIGEDDEARELLDAASAAGREGPSYYGDALVALTRMLLSTDALGGCPALAS